MNEDDLGELKVRAHKAYGEGDYEKAVELYSRAIDCASTTTCEDCSALSVLYLNRSAPYFCMEMFDKALEDVDKVIELSPTWAKGFERRGRAMLLMGNYEGAHRAFSTGLWHDPGNEKLQKGLEEAELALQKQSAKKRKLVKLTDDFDCILCMKLLYEPVTTPCGHSFCRSCLMRALDYNTACPLCRGAVYMAPDQPISVVLQNVIQFNFPDEHKQREKEMEEEKTQDLMQMPLFMLDVVAFPTQSFPLHIFEPRYRLMVRRCLAGSRRFGLVSVTSAHPRGENVGCILEIKNVQQLPDGRCFLETVATSRFTILERWIQDGYVCGKIQLISDKTDDETTREATELVEKIQQKIQNFVASASSDHACGGMKRLVKSLGEMPTSENPEKFSFWVASKLPITSSLSLQLLRSTSTPERLHKELEIIDNGSTSPHSGGCSVQ